MKVHPIRIPWKTVTFAVLVLAGQSHSTGSMTLEQLWRLGYEVCRAENLGDQVQRFDSVFLGTATPEREEPCEEGASCYHLAVAESFVGESRDYHFKIPNSLTFEPIAGLSYLFVLEERSPGFVQKRKWCSPPILEEANAAFWTDALRRKDLSVKPLPQADCETCSPREDPPEQQ